VSFRAQLAELSGSLALSAVLAGLLSTLWAAVGRIDDLTWIGSLFFLTVAIAWVVLVPAKFWNGRSGDPWSRRVVMMVLGVGIGVCALWLNGWFPYLPASESPVRVVQQGNVNVEVHPAFWSGKGGISIVAGILSYFALALCALRWWKMADPRRSARFSCFPVLAAGFWALILLFLWPVTVASPYGAVALVMASVIVQWVSPWEQPPPPATRRMRLRYA
jgi:hypothetical protein